MQKGGSGTGIEKDS
jgi:hypothetical protein